MVKRNDFQEKTEIVNGNFVVVKYYKCSGKIDDYECGWQPEYNFAKNKSRANGLNGVCKKCHKIKYPKKTVMDKEGYVNPRRREHREIDGVTHVLCGKCKDFKTEDEFSKSTGLKPNGKPISWDGLSRWCKECHNEKEYHKKPSRKEDMREYDKKRYADKKPKLIKQNIKYQKERKKKDPAFRMKCNLSSRISKFQKTKGMTKPDTTLKLVGCELDFFKKRIESMWKEGMSWDNYGHGEGKWVVDHIVPISSFVVTIPEELSKSSHYTNLQALWFSENAHKSNNF